MTKTILASVFDKTGLVELIHEFEETSPVCIIATGSTARHLQDYGFTVNTVESVTGFPEILEGRVKTLHPMVFGGILAKDSPTHEADMATHNIPKIDVVIVNLYPFEQTVASGTTEDEVIEQIDVGGVALLRAAAKNHKSVTVVSDPSQYTQVKAELKSTQGGLSPEFRKQLAQKAFEKTSTYDSHISGYFMKQQGEVTPSRLLLSLDKLEDLRYGENPQELAAWYGQTGSYKSPYTLLQGKQMSANNLVDAYAAVKILEEFPGDAACCIIKHNNPCGAAIGKTIEEAFVKAYEADPMSAFGGIFGFNRPVTASIAEQLGSVFIELVIAPEFDAIALDLLAKKKNVRLLKIPQLGNPAAKGQSWILKDLEEFGILLQQKNLSNTLPELSQVTQQTLPQNTLADVSFAWSIVKHLTSNAIVIVKDGQTVGYGIGQTSRIRSMELALQQAGAKARGAVLASDGFFPAIDNIEAAAHAGVSVIVQPGGSIKDTEVIQAADTHGLCMVLTNERCFKH